MSDTVTTQAGTLATIPTNTTIATDDIGGAHYQRIKLTQGPDGSATDVSTTTPLPVNLAFTAANTTALKVDGSAVTQPVSGTVSITTSTSPIGSVALVSGGSVAVTSSTAVIGSVLLSTAASVSVTSSTATIGNVSVAAGLSVTSITSSTAPIGSMAQAGTWTVGVSSGVTTLTSGLLVLGSLVANQSVNVAQINGVTALMGNGATGTGSHRVTIASDNTAFNVAASNETGSIYSGTTALTPLFAAISTTSSGVTTVCTAVASKVLRVVSMALTAGSSVDATWVTSDSTATNKFGPVQIAATGGYVLPYNPVGWFQTTSGQGLGLFLSGSVRVGGSLTYITV